MGRALIEGRLLHKSDKAFGAWRAAEGFGDMDRHDRADAMWLAEQGHLVADGHTPGMTHPSRIRRAFREQQAAAAIPPELQQAPPPVASVVLPKDTAKTVNKLHHRSTSGDEGSATAARMLDAYARKHGVSVEALTEAAAVADPDGCHRFTPGLQSLIKHWREGLLADAAEMVDQASPRRPFDTSSSTLPTHSEHYGPHTMNNNVTTIRALIAIGLTGVAVPEPHSRSGPEEALPAKLKFHVETESNSPAGMSILWPSS